MQVGRLQSNQLTVFGIGLGTNIQDVPQVLAPQGLELYNAIGSWAVFRKGVPTGVRLGVDKDVIGQISIDVWNQDTRSKVLEYSAGLSDDFRRFVEDYSDAVRIDIFGEGQKTTEGDGPANAVFDYQYPERGLTFQILEQRYPLPTRIRLNEIILSIPKRF
jgi:hypothetical protein